MSETNSVTGKAGYCNIDGTFLPITNWQLDVAKDYADATDSSTYDDVTTEVWKYQRSGPIGMSGTVEGNVDLDLVNDQIISRVVIDGPYPMTLGFNRTKNFVTDTMFDIQSASLKVQVTGANMVTYSFKVASSGIPTFG